jgi:sugar phosphate permease
MTISQNAIDIDDQNLLNSTERIKYYMFYDNLEMILNLANTFSYNFRTGIVPYSTQIQLEMHKYGNQSYFIKMVFNDENVKLPGACKN